MWQDWNEIVEEEWVAFESGCKLECDGYANLNWEELSGRRILDCCQGRKPSHCLDSGEKKKRSKSHPSQAVLTAISLCR